MMLHLFYDIGRKLDDPPGGEAIVDNRAADYTVRSINYEGLMTRPFTPHRVSAAAAAASEGRAPGVRVRPA